MPVEGGPDLFEALRRELSEALNQALPGKGLDLLAENLTLTAQSAFSGWNPDLKGKNPVRAGGDGDDGYRGARPVCQVVLHDDGRTCLADL